MSVSTVNEPAIDDVAIPLTLITLATERPAFIVTPSFTVKVPEKVPFVPPTEEFEIVPSENVESWIVTLPRSSILFEAVIAE